MTKSSLPNWKSLLVIITHPDDESFGLGAVLSSFIESGADVSVLCFTRRSLNPARRRWRLVNDPCQGTGSGRTGAGCRRCASTGLPGWGLQDIVLPTLLGQAVAIAKTEAARRNPGLRLFRRHRSSVSHSSDRGRISIGDRMGTRYSRMDSTEKCHEVAE